MNEFLQLHFVNGVLFGKILVGSVGRPERVDNAHVRNVVIVVDVFVHVLARVHFDFDCFKGGGRFVNDFGLDFLFQFMTFEESAVFLSAVIQEKV